MFSTKERKCKIVFIGPRGSGKVLQFVKQTYLLKEITNVHSGVFYVGGPPVDCYKRDHFIGSNIIKLKLWDTHWRQLPSIVSRCQGADGVILTFDITEEASFYEMKKQYEQLLEDPKLVIIIIQILLKSYWIQFKSSLFLIQFSIIMELQKEKLCKIVSVGPPNAGKTSLLTRITRNTFQEQYLATIGCDFASRSLIVDNQIMKLQIWDTAGQERFRTAISKAYYRGAHGVFLTFDISEETSFQEMQKYHEQLLQEVKNMNVNLQLLLVGCKSDLENRRQVSYDVALAFAQSQGMHYIETSAKMGTNCLEVADYIAREILTSMKKHEAEAPQVELKQVGEPIHKKTTCC